ncbi:MAG: hypothetical protein E8A46_07470 [Bradyrhizobium sp.]|jgi:hypothetical protein|uniref:hypothetical protein n=1 Tax=Bradyrhizobium sp. TaxID=376 RepID=UPI00120B0254|nr:hypothetical protein [Bradyrhizobium sp.]THD54704.1 MAG: hypothetical protein E8A46_07470 [Bradyrhizobium sp.]
MNLPDARGAEDFRIGEQSTHGESNPEHFLVNAISADVSAGLGTTGQIPPTAGQMLLKAPVCPVSVQPGKKTDAKNPQLN